MYVVQLDSNSTWKGCVRPSVGSSLVLSSCRHTCCYWRNDDSFRETWSICTLQSSDTCEQMLHWSETGGHAASNYLFIWLRAIQFLWISCHILHITLFLKWNVIPEGLDWQWRLLSGSHFQGDLATCPASWAWIPYQNFWNNPFGPDFLSTRWGSWWEELRPTGKSNLW